MYYILLFTAFGIISSVSFLWLFYVFVMAMKRAKEAGELHPVALFCGAPFALVGIILDFLIHVTLGTVIFLDLPREWTLSSRLSRYWTPVGTDWRCKWAGAIAAVLLDPFDPSGKHIH